MTLASVQIVMQHCFRPGDLVRARALSLGTMREYRLSTAEDSLGVVWARSRQGSALAAISAREMQCPDTGEIEPRKVAKLAAA